MILAQFFVTGGFARGQLGRAKSEEGRISSYNAGFPGVRPIFESRSWKVLSETAEGVAAAETSSSNSR